MILRLYIYRIKCLLKDKSNLFWTFIFPIVLATFFNMAFSNIYSAEEFQSIPIGLIDNKKDEKYQDFYEVVVNASMSKENLDNKLFEVTVCDEKEAGKLLQDNKIKGYIILGSEIQLFVKNSGLSETIIKTFLDTYTQITKTVTTLISNNPMAMEQIMNDVNETLNYVKSKEDSINPPDLTLNYYYALLAMACLYGCFWGLREITLIQANLSTKGARINVAPIHKMKLLICNLFAAFTIHFFGVALLLVYLILGLGINFKDNFGYVILTSVVGSILGVTFGAMVSAVVKKEEEVKYAIISGVVMLGCFLSGLMMVQMKYIVATKAPIVQYINPAHLITDAFYSLYYYDTLERFTLNIVLMVGYCILFSTITFLITRRRAYASI